MEGQGSEISCHDNWEKTFHVHVDASTIALGAILVQPGTGELDHPIAFASRKIVRVRAELQYHRKRRPSYGLCTP
jgi:hypothetical protein